jgi:hypothetical protein
VKDMFGHLVSIRSIYAELPVDKSGYGDISCKYDGLNLIVYFEYFDENQKCDTIGHLEFDYCISFFVVDQSAFPGPLPPRSGTIYSIDSIVSRGKPFSGFYFWFSNSEENFIVYARDCKILL